ncbi:MAG: lysophospholipase [Lachnospiraceae bacterium]|nr:lysophospholipase [Lachnospiraceae bacterium]
MNIETVNAMSLVDGLPLEVLIAEPDPEVPFKGIIQIVHGKCEHKERYLPFIQYMTSAGYPCMIHDHRGHGGSLRNPDDLGYMYGVGVEGFLADIHQISRLARKRWPDLPLIQFGHGMGSLAVRCFIRNWEDEVDCIILDGSPSWNPLASSGLLFAKLRKNPKKKKSSSRLLKHVIQVPYDKRFPGENADFNWLCRNQEAVDEYNRDPLCGFDLSAEGYEIYLKLIKDSYKKNGWKTQKPNLPILFVGGADDPYIGGPAPFHQALRSMRSLGYRNVKGRLYPGLRHEILNEAEKELVFSDLEKYLEKTLEEKPEAANETEK